MLVSNLPSLHSGPGKLARSYKQQGFLNYFQGVEKRSSLVSNQSKGGCSFQVNKVNRELQMFYLSS